MPNTRKWGRDLVLALIVILSVSLTLAIVIDRLTGEEPRNQARSGVEVSVLPTPTPQASVPSVTLDGVTLAPLEAGLTARLNAGRTAAGLPPLVVDADLVAIARIRSKDMATNGYLEHTSPEGESAFTLLDQWRIPYAWAGENLALDNYPLGETVAVTLEGLMASPPHRDNILNPNYTRIGVGYAEGNGGTHYYTIVFVG